tara:strand:+ start:1174 stop:1878 length:705 start_codon:yes stop_codon:yes gene_type:complete
MNKYWFTNKEITKVLCEKFKNSQNILEIGPGTEPFPLANYFIDNQDWGVDKTVIDIDIDKDAIPFPDNFFDFIYCRHVLEDIQNPDFLLKEIIRTSKAFYIETPSPLVEITRNIDAAGFYTMYNNNIYRGYIHHKSLLTVDSNHIHIIPKFPCIEYIDFTEELEQQIIEILKNKIYWNTYYLCEDTNKVKDIIVYKHGLNFKLNYGSYKDLIISMLNKNILNTNAFFTHNKINI